MDPVAEPLNIPADYGKPSRALAWTDVRAHLEEAPHYWLATVRNDGRPHVVPVDGLWLDEGCYIGGSPKTVHHHNLQHTGAAAVHIGDGSTAIVVEGVARLVQPGRAGAQRLADASREKYGYAPAVEDFAELWHLSPRRVIAWTEFPADATRFRFGP